MGRSRKKRNSTLPPNLYEGVNGHYKYRRPDTGKWYTLGKDKIKAVSAARQLNSILMAGQDLVAHVMKEDKTLFNTFLAEYESRIMSESDLSKTTINDYKNKLKHINKYFSNKLIDEISVIEVAEFLKKFPPTQSNRYRSILNTVFKHAIASGLRDDNPAEKTISRKVKKKRQRLSLEGYIAIYEKAEQWLKNSMDIALQTLQRREDIVEMEFRDVKDGYLYVIQDKTKKHGKSAYIRIKIREPLRIVLDRCRDKILSPYLIHRKPSRLTKQNLKAQTKKHYTQVTPDYLTKAFSEIRDELEIFKSMPEEERPTFHEIRALGINLYEKQGVDAQALAGHANRAMTDKYKEGHEIGWTDAEAGLDFACRSA